MFQLLRMSEFLLYNQADLDGTRSVLVQLLCQQASLQITSGRLELNFQRFVSTARNVRHD